jgi:Holliday junction DNA helicase RuvB
MPHPTPRFHDFFGQRRAVTYLQKQLAGAMARGEPFPHTIMLGSSGMGKTLLGRALAAELGTEVVAATGADDRETLAAKLLRLRAHDVLFIDEAHRLDRDAQESLYEPIDDNTVAGPARALPTRGERIDDPPPHDLPPWTLILATDQPGRLLNALGKRIACQVYFDPYSADELKKIVEAQASKVNLLISPQAARIIAEHADGIPRRAEHLIQGLRYHFPQDRMEQLGISDVRSYLRDEGYDESRLGPIEQRYLSTLDAQGPASLATLAQCLGVDAPFVQSQVEPPLIRRGLVQIVPAGRRLTGAGQELLRSRAAAGADAACEEA